MQCNANGVCEKCPRAAVLLTRQKQYMSKQLIQDNLLYVQIIKPTIYIHIIYIYTCTHTLYVYIYTYTHILCHYIYVHVYITSLPLYGVDREAAYTFLCVCSFMICCSLVGVLRPLFPPLVLTLGSLWLPLGRSWTTLGRLVSPWRSPWSAA